MTARYTLGGTILCREICQRPNRIELRLNLPLAGIYPRRNGRGVFLEPQRPGQYLWSESGAK